MKLVYFIVASIGNILCFLIGAKVGQKVVKNEDIEINPINIVTKTIENHEAKVEADKIADYYSTINKNIDDYDGTEFGQRDLPRLN